MIARRRAAFRSALVRSTWWPRIDNGLRSSLSGWHRQLESLHSMTPIAVSGRLRLTQRAALGAHRFPVDPVNSWSRSITTIPLLRGTGDRELRSPIWRSGNDEAARWRRRSSPGQEVGSADLHRRIVKDSRLGRRCAATVPADSSAGGHHRSVLGDARPVRCSGPRQASSETNRWLTTPESGDQCPVRRSGSDVPGERHR